MKKIIFTFLALNLIIAVNYNCDKIEKPYKVTENPLDTPDFPALTMPIQKYLLEDFTGHTCVNCPQAHKIADEIKNEMCDTLIVLAIHAGNNAEPIAAPYDADYRTELGNRITSDFNVSNYPSGMINRKVFDSTRVLSRNVWKANLKNIPRQTPSIGLQILSADKSSDSVNIFVKTTFLSNSNKNLKLFVVLTESGIVSAQKNNTSAIGPRPDILDYKHNHMLRSHIAPIEGSIIATSNTPISENEYVIKGYTLYLKGKPWKLDNCSIIAFVIDCNTQEVIQVEEVDF